MRLSNFSIFVFLAYETLDNNSEHNSIPFHCFNRCVLSVQSGGHYVVAKMLNPHLIGSYSHIFCNFAYFLSDSRVEICGIH